MIGLQFTVLLLNFRLVVTIRKHNSICQYLSIFNTHYTNHLKTEFIIYSVLNIYTSFLHTYIYNMLIGTYFTEIK